MAAEDLLNDGERQALTPKSVRKRAEAVLSIAQLAEAFDLSQEAKGELVDRVRAIMSDVDGKMPKRLTQAAKNLIDVLLSADEYKVPTPLAIEAPAQTEESVPVELFAKPVIQTAVDVDTPLFDLTDTIDPIRYVPSQPVETVAEITEQETPVEKPAETLHAFPTRYLKAIIGESQERSMLHASDAAAIAKALLVLRGAYRHYKGSVDYEALLVDIFSNIPRRDLLEKHAITDNAFSQWLHSFKAAILANYSKEAAAELFAQLLSGQAGDGSVTAAAPVEEDKKDTAPAHVEEVPATPEVVRTMEWTYTSLGDALADLLSLDKPSTTSLKEYLNPDIANTSISRYKRDALAALVDYVNRTFDGLDDPRLNLTPPQKAALRQLTGAWYKGNVDGTPVSVATMVRKASGHTTRELVIERVYSALDALLNQTGQEGVTTIEEASIEQDGPTEPQTHEERLEQAKKKITELVTGLGMKSEKATVLWQHIHFDDEGKYKEDTPNLRVMLHALQQRLARFGASKFENNPDGAIGLKKLVFTGMGFNTLDTVYDSLRVHNPTITKEECEQLVIDAVIELLQ